MIDKLFANLPLDCLARCDRARTGLDWSVFLPAEQLVAAVTLLYKAEYFLEDLTAIDAREGFLLVYHFEHMAKPNRVALRVLVAHQTASAPSIASVYQGAEWHERETTDFYGIAFAGNPNPVPLLLAPDMDVRPLRKEEAQRASLADLMPPHEVLRSAPGFALLPPASQPEPAGEAGAQ